MDVKRNILIISLLWCLIIVFSLLWNYLAALGEQKRLALYIARSFFEQIVVTRQWNSRHGGVYVPVTDDTQPNLYLDVPDRDLAVNPTLQLTKINPAFMTRQIAEIAKEKSGVQFHITSLKPIRPENKASSREAGYLQEFEQGLQEKGAFVEENSHSYYFYMAPLYTDKSCLKCHAKQGYKVGDVRGGISITIPFATKIPLEIMLLSHIGIGLLGLGGLSLVGKKLIDSYEVIKRQAVMDALTGIPNRRSFSESILREFNRSRRENEPLAIIMCDIDHFKAYNDTYGHSAGDDCLRKVAKSIKASLNRPGDLCARYGGEEFVVILAKTSLKGGMKVAERIRASIEEMQIPHRGAPHAGVVTVSSGVTTSKESAYDSYEDLIKHADNALYNAKNCGRNQVQYYQGAASEKT